MTVTVGGAIFGKLRGRQAESGDSADDNRGDRDNGGKDRPLDEEGGKLHYRAPRREAVVGIATESGTVPVFV